MYSRLLILCVFVRVHGKLRKSHMKSRIYEALMSNLFSVLKLKEMDMHNLCVGPVLGHLCNRLKQLHEIIFLTHKITSVGIYK